MINVRGQRPRIGVDGRLTDPYLQRCTRFSCVEDTSYKKFKDRPTSFVSWCFALANTIFDNFLVLHSTLSEKFVKHDNFFLLMLPG